MMIIDESGDLVVKVTELQQHANGESSLLKTEEFRVNRQVLIQASSVWRTMLGTTNFAEGSLDYIEFGDDPVQGTEILLRVLHNTVDERTYGAPLREIWRLVAIVKKWNMRIGFLKTWYAQWYDNQDIDEDDLDMDEQRALLFPCWRFDHPKGFATATRFLAYNISRHITERNPCRSQCNDLHLPKRIIAQLNAAKGRLRTVLYRSLYAPKRKLRIASCKCKKETYFDYDKALSDTEAWPPEEIETRYTMIKILRNLRSFKYKAGERACISTCHQDYEGIVREAVMRTGAYFDGMCLDCMDRLKPKTGDRHDDYWQHNNFYDENGWFEGCRIKHKQPSWYFSFMGRQEDKDSLQQRHKNRYEEDPDSDFDDFES